jgi:hypothetical protein
VIAQSPPESRENFEADGSHGLIARERRTSWRWPQSGANSSLGNANSLLTGKNTGNYLDFGVSKPIQAEFGSYFRALAREFPAHTNREFPEAEQGIKSLEQGIWTPEQGTEKGRSMQANLNAPYRARAASPSA